MIRKFTVLALSAIFFMFIFAVPVFASNGKSEMVNVAHRGASGHAPENTMAAFEKAFEMKADFIEIDVQMTRDGRLVAIHDTTVNRTTNGNGFVGDYTLEEIQQLDAGSWFGEEFAGERVPTFEEIIDEYRGKIGILIELKSPELYPGMEEKVAEALIERNMHKPSNGKIIIQSFNHESVQLSKQLLPNIPHGVLAGLTWADVTDEQLAQFATYADFFNPNMNIVTEDLVDRVHLAGMEIYAYTVRTQEQADNLFELEVDGIITDFPEYVYRHPVKN
ncbi:glycerophosphodiester phosphodiesterase [Oceanobacillus profundus]|uniref:Glycerophosphodiester phosphodiesterase n=1 Tax=Oceanobacillus profundus TaxID=372463 RepID=A0A417YB76_9BACI|nr:glycerophosphodiester phosphodiesterase family protein [Oceanobacillus profundus]MCM3399991.1 glycerophosphodiester phosphodiesterase [Oceanobacillus profundus]PAE27370.1 glycerophosphodiester phosphodiesterase [Paenibacillus sp. 7884-2]RHW29845.1 glycerophosphodiester phosphodiesterase [Oceanobacillus profundus]